MGGSERIAAPGTGMGARPRAFRPLVPILFLCLLAGCGERFEWDPDGNGADGSDPATDTGGRSGVLGPTRGTFVFDPPRAIPSDDGTEKAPALGVAAIRNPWAVGGSGKGSYLKLHLECSSAIDESRSGCLPEGEDAAQAFATLRMAVVDDESGLLASGQATAGAAALFEEAAKENAIRGASSFTPLAKGEAKVARGGLLVTLPLGGEPVHGWRRVILVERTAPETKETSWLVLPFRYEVAR